jgi:type II secretory pathway pseudopilin PulG
VAPPRLSFTLAEILAALVVLAVVAGAIYSIFVRGEESRQVGYELAEATQNARTGADLISRELRSAGFGINPSTLPSIVTASQYRVTFVLDLNGNHRVDMGETVTYFLDWNQADPIVALSPNPYDLVLRRKVSSPGDPLAQPLTGTGEIVVYGLTQRSGDDARSRDVPLFSYRDAAGVALELTPGTGNDPAGDFYGRRVADGGRVASILVTIVTETKQKNVSRGAYDRVSVEARTQPRTVPFLRPAHAAFTSNIGDHWYTQ